MNNVNEIWKSVTLDWFDAMFEVSSLGNVRKIVTGWHYKETPQNLSGNGYLFVQLYHRGRSKVTVTHRLVALAFIPNVLNKPIVNHKNLNKHDNRAENLEWCTHQENIRHFLDNTTIDLRTPNRLKSRKLTAVKRRIPIVQLDLNGDFIKEYDSLTGCAKENDWNLGNISMVCKGKMKRCYGFIFKYKADYINNAKSNNQ